MGVVSKLNWSPSYHIWVMSVFRCSHSLFATSAYAFARHATTERLPPQWSGCGSTFVPTPDGYSKTATRRSRNLWTLDTGPVATCRIETLNNRIYHMQHRVYRQSTIDCHADWLTHSSAQCYSQRIFVHVVMSAAIPPHPIPPHPIIWKLYTHPTDTSSCRSWPIDRLLPEDRSDTTQKSALIDPHSGMHWVLSLHIGGC